MSRLVPLAFIITILTGVYTFVDQSGSSLLVFAAVGLTIAEVSALMIAARGFTAVVIPVVVVNGLMTLGYVAWDNVRTEAAVSAQLGATDALLAGGLTSVLVLTLGMTLGGLLGRPGSMSLSSVGVAVPTGGLVLAGWVAVGFSILGRQDAIFRADSYLDAHGPLWASQVGSALAPLAALAFCYSLFRPSHRLAAAVGLAVLALILFGGATRQLALIPAILLLGKMLNSGGGVQRRVTALQVGVAGVLTMVLAQLAITMRGNPAGVGALTLGERIAQDPGVVLNEFSPARVVGNVIFCAPQAARIGVTPIPREWFWTSVNPLPGGMTEWPTIGPQLRFNIYTPYNAIGELAAQGALVVLLYGMVVGLVLSRCAAWASGLNGPARTIGVLAVLAFSTLFSVTALQYNLRNSSRLIWYALLVLLLLWAVDLTRRSVQSHRRAGERDPNARSVLRPVE